MESVANEQCDYSVQSGEIFNLNNMVPPNVSTQSPIPWQLRDRTFVWGQRTYLMGILNVTPDSFSDGGQFDTIAAALQQAQSLIDAEMDILDIGGESTRPNAATVSVEEELNRVIPVIKAIREMSNIPISIDTTKASVAKAAIAAGADLVNDISGATYDPDMLATVAQLEVPIVLMHTRGTPKTMLQMTDYQDVVAEVKDWLQVRVRMAIAAGIAPARIAVDPGIGFAKTAAQSMALLHRLAEFQELSHPLLVGPSRKSFIGAILQRPDAKERIWGTAGACCAAIAGGADILRVHDGAEMRDVCRVFDQLFRSNSTLNEDLKTLVGPQGFSMG
jgi:dihydropteroate synthase